MGGTGVAQSVEPSAIYFNPAGSFFVPRGVLIMHAENFAGIVKNEFGSVILSKGSMALGFGVQYLSVSGIKLTTLPDTTSSPGNDNQPIPYDTVGTSDVILYVNGARGNEKIAYGANIKVFYRNLSVMSGFGGGLDVGLRYNLEYLKIGLAVRDFILSPIMWDNGSTETILPKLSFGCATIIPLRKINSAITLECDFEKTLDISGFDFNVGLEYAFRNFIFGRIGVHRGNSTLGIGLFYKRFRFDYAFVTHSWLDNSNKFSAGLQF